jgi:hypothetical protein
MRRLAVAFALVLLFGAGQAMAFTWGEVGDAGDLPGSAQTPTGAGALTSIAGAVASGDADMYLIHIFDLASFGATTVGGASFDTQLWLFDTAGNGVTFNDDSAASLRSTLTNAFVSSTGNYYLALSGFDYDALDSGGNQIWLDTPFSSERAPDGPGAGNPIDHWGGTSSGGDYEIFLSGVDAAAAPIPSRRPSPSSGWVSAPSRSA